MPCSLSINASPTHLRFRLPISPLRSLLIKTFLIFFTQQSIHLHVLFSLTILVCMLVSLIPAPHYFIHHFSLLCHYHSSLPHVPHFLFASFTTSVSFSFLPFSLVIIPHSSHLISHSFPTFFCLLSSSFSTLSPLVSFPSTLFFFCFFILDSYLN